VTTPFDTFVFAVRDRLGDAPSVYLDTNAWSTLAQRSELVTALALWLRDANYQLILSRFQVVELSAAPKLFGGFADAVAFLQPIMVDRGQNEFSGKRYQDVSLELLLHLRINRSDLRREFIEQLSGESLQQARGVLKEHAKSFGEMVEAQLDVAPRDLRDWQHFSTSLARWLHQQCARNSAELRADAMVDHRRYVGLKLAYAVIYWRYVINKQRWRGMSDYVDYLHAADMAYSSVVVTERNLAEAVRQVASRTAIQVPKQIYTIDWLRALECRSASS
jgi:hypothetical protein